MWKKYYSPQVVVAVTQYTLGRQKEKLVYDEVLLVILKFICSFVETERSAYRKVVVEYSSEKHYYNYCKLICQIQISI